MTDLSLELIDMMTMTMMECEVERAKIFWEEVNVDSVFDDLMDVLTHLRDAIRHNTATDQEYVQAMKIIMESEALRTEAIEEVLIDEDILTVTVSESQCSPESLRNGGETEDVLQKDSSRLSRDVESSSDYSQMSSASRTDGVSGQDQTLLLSPLSLCSEDPRSPVQLVYQPHDCSSVCVPQLPAHADLFLGHNPLRVPMLCHFQRQCARVRAGGGEQEDESDAQDADVLYKAPCGRSLRSMEEVLQFLLQSDTLGVLQPSNFSFNAQIVPEHQAPAPASPALLFERDLSRGIEPVPVPLFNEVDGTRLKEFRYRKERWPHGCFLSAAPFFSVCCDCTDNCTDAQSCACVQLTARAGGGAHYRHQRLSEPVRAGLFECSPWCSCRKSLCQNRVVQKGLRVRLQVFRTQDRGWAVRCRDDLDKGTFICIYAGVVLRLERSEEEPPDLRSREPPVSDDEVEVVEEWTLPAGPKETVTEALDCSPPLYVPVIQRPADQLPEQACSETDTAHATHALRSERLGTDGCASVCVSEHEVLSKKPRLSNGHDTSHTHQDKMYYLDASKEGNVARFINHSCEPNLFIQNVFVDTHDPQFPLIAFFTNRSVKAGSELTWNCSYTPGSDPDHEVSCRCASAACQSLVI